MSWKDFFRRKPKEEWRLVKEVKPMGVVRESILMPHNDEKGKVFIYLYESSYGNRTVQARCTLSSLKDEDLNDFVKGTEVYLRRIYRWLMGRGDPEIPRYDEIEQEETLHYLKGTINEDFEPFTIEDK